MATTILKAWATVLQATAAMLLDLKDTTAKAARLTAAIVWWGAAVTATGRTAGTVIVTGAKKPGVKQKEKNAPMVNLFPDLVKGNHNEFNIGCLFAICCEKAGVKGWKTAHTADDWQKIGARYGLSSGTVQTVAPNLRIWFMGPESLHNVAGMKAAIGQAVSEEAAVVEAAATAAATAKAAKAAGSSQQQPTQSAHQKQSDSMTRTQQAADDLKWIRRDRAGFLSDLNRRTTSVQRFDAMQAAAKEAAAVKAAKAEAKTAKTAAAVKAAA
tara:strand:+ start:877 stop:1686 length:810 start_codon:yes stop_codon:yes gene_type:complete